MDNMGRSRADDKNDPNNFPEDSGFRFCNECGNDIAVDLTNAEETEVDEFTNCYSHLKDIESLREECSNRDRSIHGLTKDLRRERDATVASLNDEVAYLKRGWEIKDARIHEIESLVLDRDGHIEEIQAALTKSNEQFDRMNQLVQAYEKLLKG